MEDRFLLITPPPDTWLTHGARWQPGNALNNNSETRPEDIYTQSLNVLKGFYQAASRL